MTEPTPATNVVTECFIYYLEPDQGALYDEYHANVWPEVVESLRASGLIDYSIYRRGDLVISVTTRDTEAPAPVLTPEAQERVDAWAELMAPLFIASAGKNGEPLFAERVFQL